MEFTLKVSNCLGCHFCPQDRLAANYRGERTMSGDDFMTILQALPKYIECHFSGFSEPFLHNQCADMMLEAKRQGHEVHVYSTLIGLTFVGVMKIREVKPNYWRVHVPDKKGLILPDEVWIRQDKLFREAEIPATYMAMGEPTEAVKRHLAIHKTVVELPDMLSRGGNLWTPRTLNGPMRCSMNRWHSNVVMPNGDVYGCCMDYGLTVRLGNLLKQQYIEIHVAAELWKEKMERNCSGTICAQCEWAHPA